MNVFPQFWEINVIIGDRIGPVFYLFAGLPTGGYWDIENHA